MLGLRRPIACRTAQHRVIPALFLPVRFLPGGLPGGPDRAAETYSTPRPHARTAQERNPMPGTRTTIFPLRFAILALAALLAFAPSNATAQSTGDLAKENRDLKAKITELETKLERAERQIAALNNEVKRLRTHITKNPGSNSKNSPTKDQTTDDPYFSPQSFVAVLQKSYAEKFEELDLSDRRARADRLRELRPWASEMRRGYSGNIQWPVMVDERSGNAVTRQGVKFRFVDAGSPVGEPFTVRLSTAHMRALKRGTAETV